MPLFLRVNSLNPKSLYPATLSPFSALHLILLGNIRPNSISETGFLYEVPTLSKHWIRWHACSASPLPAVLPGAPSGGHSLGGTEAKLLKRAIITTGRPHKGERVAFWTSHEVPGYSAWSKPRETWKVSLSTQWVIQPFCLSEGFLSARPCEMQCRDNARDRARSWTRWIEKNLDVPKLLHRQLCEHRLGSQLWSQSLKPGEQRRWSPLTCRYIHKTHIMSSVCAGPNQNPFQSHVIVPEILEFGNSYNNKMT